MSLKKERFPNFNSKEEEILLSLVEKNKEILENKKTDAVLWTEKRKTWEKISEEFEIYTGSKRSDKNLKDKYENIKKKAKKQLAEEKREVYKTGGGKCHSKVDSATERIVALMGISATGLQNDFDSDCVVPQNESNKSDFAEEIIHMIELEDEIVEAEKNTAEIVKDNVDSWTKWNPEALKNKRSEKLKNKTSKKRQQNQEFCMPPEKIKLLEAQETFFKNEEKRSEEKHEWAKEKHNWEREHAELKKKILEIELVSKLNK